MEERIFLLGPGKNPVGHRIVNVGVTNQIVGNVKNTKSRTIGEDHWPIMYRSFEQTIEKTPSLEAYQFMVRYQGDSTMFLDAVKRVIHAQNGGDAVALWTLLHQKGGKRASAEQNDQKPSLPQLLSTISQSLQVVD